MNNQYYEKKMVDDEDTKNKLNEQAMVDGDGGPVVPQ